MRARTHALAAGVLGSILLARGASAIVLVTIPNPDPGAGENFGWSVAAAGADVVVGAPFDDGSASNAGAAYVFDGQTGALRHELRQPAPAPSDGFGWAVTATDRRILVGAPFADGVGANAGGAFVFDAASGRLLATLPGDRPGNAFGFAAAAASGRWLVGAPLDDRAGHDAGAVLELDEQTGAVVRVFTSPNTHPNDHFGAGVTTLGSALVVGAPRDDTLAPDAGVAYVLDRSTAAVRCTLTSPTPGAGDLFGSWVIGAGELILVGAWQDSTLPGLATSGYLFSAETCAFLEKVTRATPADSRADVTVLDGTLVVGLGGYNLPDRHSGAVFRLKLARCGDGERDDGEECDDGNTSGGDCCAADCSAEPGGAPCDHDALACTDQRCDGGGTCQTIDHCEVPVAACSAEGVAACGPCARCDPAAGCLPVTEGDCAAVAAGPVRLQLRKGRLVWHWREDRDLPDDGEPLCLLVRADGRLDRLEPAGDKDVKHGFAVTVDASDLRVRGREADGVTAVAIDPDEGRCWVGEAKPRRRRR